MTANGMTNFQAIAYWNYLGGVEPKESPTLEDKLMVKLIKEEYQEFIDEVEKGNLQGAIEELSDLLFVVYGGFYRSGTDGDACANVVIQSNFSKFCKTEEAAEEEVTKYNNKFGQDYARYDKVQDLYVLRRNEDDKILKPSTYTPKDFSALGDNND